MTPEQIAALTDTELNQACAERVMGWRIGEAGYKHADGDWTWKYDWAPATFLSDAGMCLNAVVARGKFRFAVELYPDGVLVYLIQTHLRYGFWATAHVVENRRRPRAEAEGSLIAVTRE